jgi:uncharacterized protein (TIGR02453 family)
MRFQGWPTQAITWFEGLEADNSRAFFQAHRGEYDESVRGPLEALLDEVADEFGEGHAFRPNRDVRFSKDKSPYKTHAAAAIGRKQGGAYYVHISADGLLASAGYPMMAGDQVDRFRRAVADDATGPELEAIVAGLRARRYEITGHEPVKTAPRGYPRDHPRIELIRHRDLFVNRHHPPGAWLATRRALDRVIGTWRAAAPLLAWFDEHVGPTTEAEADSR